MGSAGNRTAIGSRGQAASANDQIACFPCDMVAVPRPLTRRAGELLGPPPALRSLRCVQAVGGSISGTGSSRSASAARPRCLLVHGAMARSRVATLSG